jgi:perosamine synthetase
MAGMSVTPETQRPRLRLARPEVGEAELDAIRRVFASGILTNGEETIAFERAFAHRHHAEHGVAFANGTVALAGVFLALGIGPGDDVIVPSFTFISTATSVLHVGARPVFADIDPETFNLDPVDVSRRLTPATKAIVPVHYGGQPADMAPLRTLADEARAWLIEDAAEAHGATYQGRPVGAIGHAGMFSFTPTKNITTGEGGLITTNDGALAERLRLLRSHGQTDQYVHSLLGYNWRLSEMQAAMGLVQLDKLDSVLARKRERAAHLTRRLHAIDGIRPPIVRDDRDHVFMLFTTAVEPDLRDHVLHELLAQGIEARLYFPPAHQQPVFADEHGRDDLPVTNWAAAHALSLPLHAQLTMSELDEIADAIATILS